MMNKQIILNKSEIKSKITRIAFSIIEDYYMEQSVTLIGFEKNGHTIGKKIKKIIEKNHNMNVVLHSINSLDEYQYRITPKLTKETIKNINKTIIKTTMLKCVAHNMWK